MKNLTISIFFLIALISTGCDDMLDTEPYSIITSQNMWSSESEARAGIAGMYNQFRSTFNDFDFLIYFELRSGFWQTGASGAAQWDDLFNNTPNATSTPSLNWKEFYKIINSANLAVKYIPEINFGNQEEKDNLLADAYFIRAYTYFSLARIWGDVPLVLSPFESVNDENLYPEKADVNKVFEQIKMDIDMALENIKDESPRGRVMASQAAINMLKTDVYLWTSKRLNGGTTDLNVANQAVDQVLSNADYSLLENYEQVFRNDNNNELIFSIYFDVTESSNQYGGRFLFQAGQVDSQYRENPVPIGNSSQWLTFNDHFVNDYLLSTPGDTRAEVNNLDYDRYRWVNKFLGEIISNTRNDVTDTRIYRYAEAILFKAEILNALNKTSEAVTELNKIAKRAYGVDNFYDSSLTQAEVDNAILHERLIEFGAEGKSWFDIIRFGKAFELIPSLVGRQNEYEGNILVLPVDLGTITRNPNITQTPGY